MFSLSTVMRPAVSSVRTTASSGPCQVALSPIGGDVRPPPPLVIVTLMSFSVITPDLGLSLGLAAALRIVDALGWRAVAAIFDRERLVTGTRT